MYKGQITGIFTCRKQDRHLPLKKLTPLSLSKKGDTEGFIRGTVQGISSSNSAESFQFGAKPQIASYHPVNREGRRIPENIKLNYFLGIGFFNKTHALSFFGSL